MLGLYEVLRRDERKWPLLALGMTGVCMSHLLSTMFCVLFCAIAALASAEAARPEAAHPRGAGGGGRYGALRAVVLRADDAVYGGRDQHERRAQFVGIRASAGQLPRRLCGRREGGRAGGFRLYHRRGAGAGAAHRLRAAAGAALCGGARRNEDGKRQAGAGAAGAGRAGAGAEHGFLPVARPLFAQKAVFHLLHADSVPVALCRHGRADAQRGGGVGLSARGEDAKTGMAALIALCVVFSGYTMQTMVQRAPELEKETYTDTRIGQFEYTYPCTEKTALKVGDVRTSQPGVCNVLSYEKARHRADRDGAAEGEAAYIELPLLYYPAIAPRSTARCRRWRAERTTWCASTACRRAKAARFTSGISRRRRG